MNIQKKTSWALEKFIYSNILRSTFYEMRRKNFVSKQQLYANKTPNNQLETYPKLVIW